MSSIANRKFTDMKQIEFQQNGSGEISAMLTQPLLENSSTYMCEVTDLQCTIGRELAFPEDQWLFSIVRRPLSGTHTAFLNTQKFKEFVRSMESGPNQDNDINFYGTWIDDNGQIEWVWDYWKSSDNTPSVIPYAIRGMRFIVLSGRYYSAMDFVYDISRRIQDIDKEIKHKENEELAADEQKDNGDDYFNWTEDRYHIGVGCDAGGRIVFRMSQYFRRNYMMFTSKLFQEITGYHRFIGEYSTDGHRDIIYNIDDFVRLNPTRVLDAGQLEQITEIDEADAQFQASIWILADMYSVAVFAHPRTTGDMRIPNGSIIPIQDGIDIRKKIIVEVSLPISHTLAWNGEKESTRYVLQEFVFPSESLSFGFDSQSDFTKSSIKFRVKSLHGEMVLLNGGTTLALKKLQEGQMQAFRVSVLLEYDDWDNSKQAFVRKKRPLDLEQGGFFYLKLLFTKETI